MNMKKVASIALAGVMATSALATTAMAAAPQSDINATTAVAAYDAEISDLLLLIEGAKATQNNLYSLMDQLKDLKSQKAEVILQKRLELAKEASKVNDRLNELYAKLYQARENRWTVIASGKVITSADSELKTDVTANCTAIKEAVAKVVRDNVAKGEIVSVTYSSYEEASYAFTEADKAVLNALKEQLADVAGDYTFSISIWPNDTAEDVVNNFLTMSLIDDIGNTFVFTQGKLYAMK